MRKVCGYTSIAGTKALKVLHSTRLFVALDPG